jgi:drug/metabolite transporter (DMT)-like permease
MSLLSLALILISAGVHVVAHIALKTSRNRDAFVWWMLLWGCLFFTPLIWWNWSALPAAVWPVMLASAVFEAGYFAAIARAYRTGDLSIIYPLARGLAPLFLLIWSALFLGERPTPGGIGGVVLIAAGLYVINLPRFGAWLEPLRAFTRQAGPRWALLAGLCISAYTVLDRYGIRQADPLVYTTIALWMTWLILTPITLRLTGWEALRHELGQTRWRTALAGFTTLTAYAIILYVMQTGTPASYAGATREVSVVLGTAAGILLLKEQGGAMRVLGALLVAGGVIAIKFLG